MKLKIAGKKFNICIFGIFIEIFDDIIEITWRIIIVIKMYIDKINTLSILLDFINPESKTYPSLKTKLRLYLNQNPINK